MTWSSKGVDIPRGGSARKKCHKIFKLVFSIFLIPPHIDSDFCIPSMNATDGCYKTWKYTAAHLTVLHDGYDREVARPKLLIPPNSL